MTQYYKMPGFSLARANPSTKVLLTLFLLCTAGGLAVAMLQYSDRAGLSRKAAMEWIHGNEEDLEATEFKSPKSYRELLAITHDHAFSLPILLFVLLHLVALCTIGEGWKIAFYLAGFLSLIGSLAGPWLIAYQGEGWTILMIVSGSVMCLVIGSSTALALWETWGLAPYRRWRGRPEVRPPDPLFAKRREREP